jgi:hypothetical protein
MSSGRRVSRVASRSLLDSFPFKGGEGVMGLFEEASDRVWCHFGLFGFRCRTGAIKDCDDDNKGNCVGEGKLKVLGAFGDSSESVGSRNGNGGFSCLFCVQFKLDFHFCASKKGQKLAII